MAAFVKIKFSNTDGSNIYELPINPSKVEIGDSDDYDLLDTLDGAAIKSTASFDSRPRILSWPYHVATNTTFSGMVSELKTYIGVNKKIYLGTVDAIFSYDWRYIRVIDVASDLKEGGALRRNLLLTYVYTQSY